MNALTEGSLLPAEISRSGIVNRGGAPAGPRRDNLVIQAAADIMGAEPGFEERTFGAKCLVSASLPYREPKPEQLENGAWVRRNGDYTLWLQGGPGGLPYGSYPRIFVIWLTTEAIRTGNRRISTGGTFSTFAKKLNIDRSRGKNGAGRRFIDQAERLLNSRALFITKPGGTSSSTVRPGTDLLQFADEHSLFFEDRDQQSLFSSEIVLTDKFFREITEHCIPLDMRAVLPLQQAPLELDIYQWLAYRMFSLTKKSYVTWNQLYLQFGSSYARPRAFRAAFIESLHNVLQVYPHANVEPTEKGLELSPSLTSVPKKIVQPD